MDLRLLRAINAHRPRLLDSLARGLMQLGTSLLVIAIVMVAALALVIALRAYRAGAAVALAVTGATAIAGILKHVIGRSRPPASLALVHLGGYSMPSTHAARTAAATSALVVVLRLTSSGMGRAVSAVLLVLTVVVGVAMVYLGAHWATDVLVGWALGVATGALAGIVLRERPPSLTPAR